MTSETERKNNANRLAYSLECISEDANKIKAVAQMLKEQTRTATPKAIKR